MPIDRTHTFLFNGVRMYPVKPKVLFSQLLLNNIAVINYCRCSVIKTFLKDAYSLSRVYSRWWRGYGDRSFRSACTRFINQEKKFLLSIRKIESREKLLERYYNEILTGEGLTVYGCGDYVPKRKIRPPLKIDTGPYWRKRKKRKPLKF